MVRMSSQARQWSSFMADVLLSNDVDAAIRRRTNLCSMQRSRPFRAETVEAGSRVRIPLGRVDPQERRRLDAAAVDDDGMIVDPVGADDLEPQAIIELLPHAPALEAGQTVWGLWRLPSCRRLPWRLPRQVA